MASTSVFLNVHDMEKSLAFYKALGWKIVSEVRDDESGELWYVDLDRDGAEVGLGAIAANDDPEFRKWVGTPLGAGVVVYFSVDDVDTVFEKARDTGAVIEHPPQDRPYGRALTIDDPDGYTLTFLKE